MNLINFWCSLEASGYYNSPSDVSGELILREQNYIDNATSAANDIDEFDNFLWSLEAAGYYNSPSDVSGELILRERNYIDNATPAANGIAVANLVRLSLLTEELYYLDRAESALTAFSSIMKQSPQACPSLFVALDWYRNQTLVRTSEAEISSLITQYFPTTIYQVEADLPKNSVGLVCQGLICKKPSLSKQELLEHLEQSQNRWTK